MTMTQNLSGMHASIADTDLRVAVPLYTFADVARIADLSPQTVLNWASPNKGITLVESFPPQERGFPRVSFMGLTIFLLIAYLRNSGVSMNRIKPALANIDREFGIKYAITHKMIHTDGIEVLLETLPSAVGRDMFQPRTGQTVMKEIINAHLRVIEYAEDGYPSRLKISKYDIADVVVDPGIAFGSPIFRSGGVTLDRIKSRLLAGEKPKDVSEDFGVPLKDIEDVWRVDIKLAA